MNLSWRETLKSMRKTMSLMYTKHHFNYIKEITMMSKMTLKGRQSLKKAVQKVLLMLQLILLLTGHINIKEANQ